MIAINITLIIQMVNFLLFLVLMNLVLYRPIRRLMAQRNQHVAEQQEGIDQANADAASAEQEFDGRIGEARRLGRQRIQDLKDSAYQEEKLLLQQATEEAAKQLQQVRRTVQAEIGTAREQLREQIKAFSVDLAQKILGRSI